MTERLHTTKKTLMLDSKDRGFMLLLAILVSSIALAIGAVVLNVTIKQLQLSGISKNSELAFHAADAGVECLRFRDLQPNKHFFDLGVAWDAQDIVCFDSIHSSEKFPDPNSNNKVDSFEPQEFEWTWDNGLGTKSCTDATIYKVDATGGKQTNILGTGRDCNSGSICTVIKSRGYNAACTNLSADGTVERELTITY